MTKNILLFILLITLRNLSGQPGPKILIVYYSQQGHTEEMAEAVEKGANSSEGAVVKRIKVQDAVNEDVLWADAIIVGSPVYSANVAPKIQSFINHWPFQGAPMKDKVGAAFVSAGGISAGEESVQLNILKSMLIFGMVIVGGPSWDQAFGASAVVEEAPYNEDGKVKVSPQFLLKGEKLGKRVAQIAKRFVEKE